MEEKKSAGELGLHDPDKLIAPVVRRGESGEAGGINFERAGAVQTAFLSSIKCRRAGARADMLLPGLKNSLAFWKFFYHFRFLHLKQEKFFLRGNFTPQNVL